MRDPTRLIRFLEENIDAPVKVYTPFYQLDVAHHVAAWHAKHLWLDTCCGLHVHLAQTTACEGDVVDCMHCLARRPT